MAIRYPSVAPIHRLPDRSSTGARSRTQTGQNPIEGFGSEALIQTPSPMAPELTIGLCGQFVSFCSSIELNASPLGSTSTCCHPLVTERLDCHAKGQGFEID